MDQVVEILRKSGIRIPSTYRENPRGYDLRSILKDDSLDIEVDPDGSRRLRLPGLDNQLVLTAKKEIVVVHQEIERNGYYFEKKLVCADTTRKAANWLTKMRIWQFIWTALVRAKAIGQPEGPSSLREWIHVNDQESHRLHHQVDAIGLVAEKTHQFSAQIFEPALLAPIEERGEPLQEALVYYFVAGSLKKRVNEHSQKRLQTKVRDPAERETYRQKIEELDARATSHYHKAREMFQKAQAVSLANRCKAITDAYAEATAIHRESGMHQGGPRAPQLRSKSNHGKEAETRRLIEAENKTLVNTVQTINRLEDATQQRQLERHLARHLTSIAQNLRNPREMMQLLEKIRELESVVTVQTYINCQQIQTLLSSVKRQRPDLL